jgi:hypothetical protein
MANPNPELHPENLTPGNPKATGRPPDAWRLVCRELASRDEILAAAREVLGNKDHPAWLGAWKFVTEQGYGKGQGRLDVTSKDERVQVVIVADESRI